MEAARSRSLHAGKNEQRKNCYLPSGLIARLHLLDFLADFLSFFLDFVHRLAHARAGRFILFIVEFLEILLECCEQVL